MRKGKKLTIWQQHDSQLTSQHSLQSFYCLTVPRGEYPFPSVQLLSHQLAKTDRCRRSELRVRFLRRLLWIVSLWARGAGRVQGGLPELTIVTVLVAGIECSNQWLHGASILRPGLFTHRSHRRIIANTYHSYPNGISKSTKTHLSNSYLIGEIFGMLFFG